MSSQMWQRRTITPRSWRLARYGLAVMCVLLLAACSSTTPQPATESERIAAAMRQEGVDIVNLTSVPIKGPRGQRIAENFTFDIPSISIQDGPTGTLQIFADADYAESQRRMYSLLGSPGPVSKLDYVTIEGTQALILNHQLPNDIAQRYIAAFKKSATPQTQT